MVITYTGHGSFVTDTDGDEDDGKDGTWQLADGDLVDDELYNAWLDFAPGVEIRVLADACYSATAIASSGDRPPKQHDEPVYGICSDQNGKNNSPDRDPTRRPKLPLFEPPRPLPRCSVFLLAAAIEDREATFGALSSRTVKTLKRWRQEGHPGTWDELRQVASSLGVPAQLVIGVADPAASATPSLAFYPHS